MARKSTAQAQTDQTDQTAELSPEEQYQADEAARVQAEKDAQAEAARQAELDFIAAPVMLSAELTKVSAPQRERSPLQLKMDETVKTLHDTWAKNGRPSTWGTLVSAGTVATYFLPPEKSADTKKLITKAAALHDTRVRWGSSFSVTPELAAKHGLPDTHIGREVVSFAIMDKRPRTTNGDATAAQTDAMLTSQKPSDEATAEQNAQTDAMLTSLRNDEATAEQNAQGEDW